MILKNQLSSSFRDPSGFLFTRDGVLYRQINTVYRDHYDRLMESNLYQKLVDAGLLIPHQEVAIEPADPQTAYKIIQPERVEFISYPYEWCFSQLKDAALATLSIQRMAIAAGFSLKDASAYNIQFHQGHPVLIDSLSFEILPKGKPWVAYRQFCQHFLAPLALMSLVDVRLSQLLRVYIDGIPLDLASRLLPFGTRLNFGILTHLHVHASAQRRYADQDVKKTSSNLQMGETSLLGLIDSLQSTVRGLSWKPAGTEWAEYYTDTNYSASALEKKRQIIKTYLEKIQPRSVWDLGANTGLFSRIASDAGTLTVASDIDPAAVELNYRDVLQKKEQNILPLVLDLTNPSPGIGWANEERTAWMQRGPVDVVLALALIHHLAISNNVPFSQLAAFFASLGRWLVIEFVPKSDSQVQRLLSTREDIFSEYTREGLERTFGEFYQIQACEQIEGSQRILYLMKKLRE